MWSIESWAKLEEDFERSQKQQNKREFDEDTEYKTIFLLCDPSDSEEQEVEEEVVINKKRKVSDNNKGRTKYKISHLISLKKKKFFIFAKILLFSVEILLLKEPKVGLLCILLKLMFSFETVNLPLTNF